MRGPRIDSGLPRPVVCVPVLTWGRFLDHTGVCISVDETTTKADIDAILAVFADAKGVAALPFTDVGIVRLGAGKDATPTTLRRMPPMGTDAASRFDPKDWLVTRRICGWCLKSVPIKDGAMKERDSVTLAGHVRKRHLDALSPSSVGFSLRSGASVVIDTFARLHIAGLGERGAGDL